jgi:hypothetical protein
MPPAVLLRNFHSDDAQPEERKLLPVDKDWRLLRNFRSDGAQPEERKLWLKPHERKKLGGANLMNDNVRDDDDRKLESALARSAAEAAAEAALEEPRRT